MFVARLRTYADCHCLCRRFAAFVFCAASTQGSYSEDFAWHDVVRWPCYNSKRRARELARASQPVMRHAAGLQHQCQGNSPSPPPCALRGRAVSLRGEDPRSEGRAAGGSEPGAGQSGKDLKGCIRLAVLQVPGISTSGPRNCLPLEKCARGHSARD